MDDSSKIDEAVLAELDGDKDVVVVEDFVLSQTMMLMHWKPMRRILLQIHLHPALSQ
jgi:hypothetical protein